MFQYINYSLFYTIWNGLVSVLGAFFSFIDDLFRAMFNSIPDNAITFLIGILCYAVLEFFVFFINREDSGNRKLALKLFKGIVAIFTILFSLWRFGIITQIESGITFQTLSDFIVNMVYILFAIILVIAFFKKITWLKKALIVMLWFLFASLWILSI